MTVLAPSSTLHERALAVIPGGVNSGQRQLPGIADLGIVAAQGSTFTTQDGRRFSDYHAAFGPQLLGHADPDVDAAVAAATRRIDLLGVGVTDLEVELAERLVAVTPSFEQVLLTTSGSEATFHAVRLARAVTGRPLLIKFQGCFHGWHDSVAMNVISPAERVGTRDPISKGILPSTLEATVVCRWNDTDDLRRAFEANPDAVAAVILEPIPHNVGALLPEPGFLAAVRELCDRFGALLIFDEVITGFRHAIGGFETVVDVRPDLATRGKAMGNGYPIGAIGGRADLMQRFSSRPGGDVMFAGTYNGHASAVAAAIAVIDKLQREPVHAHVFRLGQMARDGFADITSRLGVPAVAAGFGSVFCTYFLDGPVRSYDDLLRNDADLYVGYRLRSLDEGIFELPMNLKRSHVSYAHTEGDVSHLLEAAERSMRHVLDSRAGGRSA
jgi:glutamate-1-semialdehyde 2,1-aminomutase